MEVRKSEIEKAQFIAMFMAFSLHTQDAFFKRREGSLSQELFRSWEYVTMNVGRLVLADSRAIA